MSGDVYVRFRESLGVRFPRATRLVVGFQNRADAVRFQAELAERFHRFGLELHADKTRLIEFGRYAAGRRSGRGEGKPETFNFLGFTHICGKTRQGWFQVKRKSVRKRVRAKLKEIKQQLRRRMHDPVRDTGRWLGPVIRGWFNYHAVPDNCQTLQQFRTQVTRLWLQTLRRRSQRGRRRWDWKRMARLADRWLPKARIRHPYPHQRLIVTT